MGLYGRGSSRGGRGVGRWPGAEPGEGQAGQAEAEGQRGHNEGGGGGQLGRAAEGQATDQQRSEPAAGGAEGGGERQDRRVEQGPTGDGYPDLDQTWGSGLSGEVPPSQERGNTQDGFGLGQVGCRADRAAEERVG